MIALPAQETDLLRHLAVRLLQEHERPEFDRLPREKHRARYRLLQHLLPELIAS